MFKEKVSSVLLLAIFALGFKALGAFATFSMTLVLTHALGVEESGLFLLAFTGVVFLAAVTRCGLDNVVLRQTAAARAAQCWRAIRLIFTRSLLVGSVAAGGTSLVVYIFSYEIANRMFSKPALGPVLAAISPAILPMALLWLLAQSFQAMGRIGAAVMGMSAGVSLVFVVALLTQDIGSAEQAAFWFSICSFFVLFLSLGLWHLLVHHPATGTNYFVSWRVMLRAAGPLWIVLLLTQVIQWFGQFVAGAYVEVEEIAQLAIAQRTAMLTSFILMAVNLVVAPRFASLYSQGSMDGLKSLALTSVRLMVAGATPVVGIMLLWPAWLMSLFGQGFDGGSHLLQILAIGQFVNVMTGSVGYLLIMSGHEKDLRNTLLTVAPLSIALTLILTPIYGATGSAIATALAVGAQNVLAVYWVKRRLGFNALAIWRLSSPNQ